MSAAPRPVVLVTRALSGAALAPLREAAEVRVWPGPAAPTAAELRAAVAEVDGLLCMLTDRVDPALLAAAPRLRVVSSNSVGVDHIDLGACAARGIPVGHTPGVLTDATADLTLALLLAAARRVVEGDAFVRAGKWRAWDPGLLLGRSLSGATLGLVGLGPIGAAVARRARAFGMKLSYWSRSPHPAEEAELAPELSNETWRQWRIDWEPQPGSARIACRAFDADGTPMPEERSEPLPDGATGWQSKLVIVQAA